MGQFLFIFFDKFIILTVFLFVLMSVVSLHKSFHNDIVLSRSFLSS